MLNHYLHLRMWFQQTVVNKLEGKKINMKCRLIVIGKAFKYILKKCNNLIRIDTQLQDMLTYYLHVRKCISKL